MTKVSMPAPRLVKTIVGTVLGTVVFLGAGAARRAEACGGLFCSAAMPVNQAAERIIFSYDKPAKQVTAVVEILYQGPSEKFAWVLPVPGIPGVGVSSSAILDRLQAMTNPTYTIQRDFSGACQGANSRGTADGGTASGPSSAPGMGPAVSVLAAGSVGPYDYQVIMVDPTLPDPAQVAINWLQTNLYDVGALGPDVLRPYLQGGMNLIAFRLSKNQSAGSIRPVILSYTSERPMIPIRPTAVAANDDMGILVWVLGAGRAVPSNYASLELNEALIDWFNPATSYNDVVTAAADEAGGRGFVTEMAAPTATRGFANALYVEQGGVQNFRQNADGLSVPQLVVSVVDTFATSAPMVFMGPFASRSMSGRVALDGVTDVLAKHLVLPPGVTIDDVVAAPRCYFAEFRVPGTFYCEGRQATDATIDVANFDRVAFLTDVEALIVKPLEDTAALFARQPYVTRLYTTLSAREMILDPEFDLNPGLPDVDNNHAITLKYAEGCFDINGSWTAEIQGHLIRGSGTTWPLSVKAQTMPVNRRVLQLSTTGEGMVLADNTATIRAALGNSPAGADSSGGCAVAKAGARPPVWAWVFLALFLVPRLRRGRARPKP